MKTIDKIIGGLKQALAHARGQNNTVRVTDYVVEPGFGVLESDANQPPEPPETKP